MVLIVNIFELMVVFMNEKWLIDREIDLELKHGLTEVSLDESGNDDYLIENELC
jgi:hypothetical protein